MKRFSRLLAAFLLVLCSGFASAESRKGSATYFVAPTGSDENPGTRGKPFASLQKANTLLAPGDYGRTAASKVPTPAPRHVLRGCVAVGNKQSGLYANHHTGGCDWFYNSAYRNKRNVNMLNRPPDNGKDRPGYDHVLENNLSYKGGRSPELHNTDLKKCTLKNNSFDLQDTPSPGDFISLDEDQLKLPRKADGSLPDITLMVPKNGSRYKGMGCSSYKQKSPKNVKLEWRKSIPR